MAGRYCEEKIKMASEKVSSKMVLEIKYVNANNAVIHTENLVTGILAKISRGTGIWAKFRLRAGIWYPPSRPSRSAGEATNLESFKTLIKTFLFKESFQLSKHIYIFICNYLLLI